jgi:hypothetical protein
MMGSTGTSQNISSKAHVSVWECTAVATRPKPMDRESGIAAAQFWRITLGASER